MRRIPTIVGLILVAVLLGSVAVLATVVQRATGLLSSASPQDFVLAPAAANISDTGFAVFWLTSQETPGSVLYGTSSEVNEGAANSDQGSAHLVSVTNLKPGVKYYYRVAGDNSAPLEATTAVSGSVPVTDSVFGKVLDAGGLPLSSAIVVLEVGSGSGTRRFAAISKTDGTFVLPVAGVGQGESEVVTVTSLSGTASVSCQSGKDRPLPDVKIGETLDCQKKVTAAETPPTGGFQTPAATSSGASASGELQVLLENGETVSTPLPTISGKAGPGQMVKIVINSPASYSGSVKADASGGWSWTPPANLSPGEHTATITITNPDGTVQTVTRTFQVPGDSILPVTSGTPSAQLTHLACVNSACQAVSGSGTDACVSDADCAPAPPATHKACQNHACVAVDGAGADSCVGDTDCAPPVTTPPPNTGAWENTLLLGLTGLLLLLLGAFTRLARR